jgi:hypothetical protein
MIEFGVVVETTTPVTIKLVKFRNSLLCWALQRPALCYPLPACQSGERTMINRPLIGFSTGAREVSHASVN